MLWALAGGGWDSALKPYRVRREPRMSTSTPAGYSALQPWLVSRDTAGLLDFIASAFGGQELARVPTQAGGIGHAEVRVGDSILLAFDAQPDWPDTPSM